ncbi:MAG: tryptophan synthase subunit alpha [Acidobacteria bacterium]|nr:tryptophan synthase subunit alpha [Acidobacteriota bacterium]
MVAGDPDLATSKALIHELGRRGADVIELGAPFSIRSPTASRSRPRPSGR